MSDKNISLTGRVLVCDIVAALEPKLSEGVLSGLDKELAGQSDDRIEFDDVEVGSYDAVNALEEADELPEPESLTYTLDQGDVQGLAEAIRCGETERAELLFDRLFSATAEFSTIREWIDRGRFSKKAREAKTAAIAKPRLRNAA
jgi:hypothetical protein